MDIWGRLTDVAIAVVCCRFDGGQPDPCYLCRRARWFTMWVFGEGLGGLKSAAG